MSNTDIKKRLDEYSECLLFLVKAVDELVESGKADTSDYLPGMANIISRISLDLQALSNEL